jgi:hypothetical protein
MPRALKCLKECNHSKLFQKIMAIYIYIQIWYMTRYSDNLHCVISSPTIDRHEAACVSAHWHESLAVLNDVQCNPNEPCATRLVNLIFTTVEREFWRDVQALITPPPHLLSIHPSLTIRRTFRQTVVLLCSLWCISSVFLLDGLQALVTCFHAEGRQCACFVLYRSFLVVCCRYDSPLGTVDCWLFTRRILFLFMFPRYMFLLNTVNVPLPVRPLFEILIDWLIDWLIFHLFNDTLNIIRGPFENFVDWQQCAAVMQREAVTYTKL